ncbi:Patatin-like protein 2 [Camellia lanceoleosa]|uniref:Patatin-like protein 2 n=1 Tax=Camellia lanceoleosa TaxID=1840588 RepID=A0ACC0ICH2_9ERIC|nr:Patatin-like protein 2 [Camellia lanceoleosa]
MKVVVAQSPGQIQAPTYRNLITILSIDGDGIQEIIPATILTFLESQLQHRRSCDHMLIAPNENNRQRFATKDIKDFYLDNSLLGPKYDGKKLREVVKEKFGETKLHQTLTNVSNLGCLTLRYMHCNLGFPAHSFKTKDPTGTVREFNLIDSSMAANNPTLIAIGEVTKQIMRKSAEYFAIKQMDYGRLLVISLGTGTQKTGQKYSAIGAAKWGLMGWLTNGSSTPLIDVFTQASSDMVDFHLSVVFQALHSGKNYLRIQVKRGKN